MVKSFENQADGRRCSLTRVSSPVGGPQGPWHVACCKVSGEGLGITLTHGGRAWEWGSPFGRQ